MDSNDNKGNNLFQIAINEGKESELLNIIKIFHKAGVEMNHLNHTD